MKIEKKEYLIKKQRMSHPEARKLVENDIVNKDNVAKQPNLKPMNGKLQDYKPNKGI